jgi:hypothetical protein
MSGLAGLPPVDQATLPADVRSAPPAARNAYAAALGFERMLVTQLTSSLADSSGGALGGTSSANGTDGTSDGTGGSSSTTSPYAGLLPDALASGIMDAGGLGLARQLAGAIDPAIGQTAPTASTPKPSTVPVTGDARSGGAAV